MCTHSLELILEMGNEGPSRGISVIRAGIECSLP